jgi:hypothetical protein
VIVAFAPDLADRSRIEAAIPQVTFIKSLVDLPPADVVILDLSRMGELPIIHAARVIGFGPHVDDALLERARAAGIDARPRSRFFRELPDLLG